METATVLFLFLIVFSFDGLSQLTGAMVGKNKMLKQISPGKTWEGLAGGIIGTFLIVLFIKNDFSPFLKNSFITWLLIIFFAFVGDVLASLLKRISGVKDFGRLIPGHGGVLDRFDSMFVAGSALYLYNLILPL
jgi:phosphatidate cytidylyltransferase